MCSELGAQVCSQAAIHHASEPSDPAVDGVKRFNATLCEWLKDAQWGCAEAGVKRKSSFRTEIFEVVDDLSKAWPSDTSSVIHWIVPFLGFDSQELHFVYSHSDSGFVLLR